MFEFRSKLLLALYATCLSCASGESPGSEQASARRSIDQLDVAMEAQPAADPASDDAGFLATKGAQTDSGNDEDWGEPLPHPRPEPARMRIYRARVDLLVGSVKEAVKSFVDAVEKDGGYLETRENGSLTVRIPAAQFWTTLEALKAMGTVLSESQSTEDVTRQYQDLELRIQTAETSRTRLLALLEKAQDTKALLEIENEVRRLTEEIETMRGQLKNLAQLVAYSTISANFRAAVPEVPRPRNSANRFPWLDRVGPEPMLGGF